MEPRTWTEADAARHIAVPQADDDKYTRGVVGFVTGSARYPGAAVLGVDAALHTGVGMVRYLGAERATDHVLQRRPEAVSANGRVQAWVVGSGQDAADRDEELASLLDDAVARGNPMVVDAGALDLVPRIEAPVIVTPHFRELSRMIGADPVEIAGDPTGAARRAADELGVTVLLKGARTVLAGPGVTLFASSATPWLATAGAGDALAGVLGALVATHADEVAGDERMLAQLGATAAVLHGMAARRASAGGPFTVLGLIAALPATIAELLRQHPSERP